MPFPESGRVIYSRNPLVEVICQLRFPPVLQIAAHEPVEFQNRVRAAYPLYEVEGAEAQLPKEISNILSQVGVGQPDQVVHKFLRADSGRFITLARDFIAVAFNDYGRWEDFRQEVATARVSLETVYQPAFYTRVGLRYRDIIDKAALGLHTEPWSELVNSAMIGILGAPEVSDSMQTIQTNALMSLSDIPGGLVRLRHGLVSLSPDQPLVYAIDADFYTEERSMPEHVTELFDRFNRLAGYLFRWSITPRLHDALEPQRIE